MRYEHCLFDGMHTLELGVLPYLENMSFWYLIMASFWGQFSADGDNSDVELAFNRDLVAWYEFMGIGFRHRFEFSFQKLGICMAHSISRLERARCCLTSSFIVTLIEEVQVWSIDGVTE